jgi:MFS family permease
MTGVLGASIVTVGMIEGIAEAAVAVSKAFSGAVSDYFRRRKPLILLGYGLSALTKPAFAMAGSINAVFAARFADRVGKGIRGAPRDALVADLAEPEARGAAYGLRQALDSAGAFMGPLLAVAFMALLSDDIRAVLWVAVVPAFIAVALILFGIHEPRVAARRADPPKRISLAGARSLPRRFRLVVALGAVFTLARFSEAFLILRAQDVGLAVGMIPMIMVVMNLAYAAAAWPAGIVSDRVHPRAMLVAGLALLISADVALAIAASPKITFVGAGLWGLHMAFTQGLFAKLVADSAPEELRGTAFGVFNLVSGGALLLASALAGWLWSAFGPTATFLGGAFFAAAAAAGLVSTGRRRRV